MSKQDIDFKTHPFQCPLVGREVTINRQYRVLFDGSGVEVARAPMKTTCSDMNKCPIATHHPGSITYDWSKCAFVKAQPE